MSYTALYRKFRPAVFDDVKGQEHIVTTLKNQISAGRFSHAYLFCGTRGTGKTTIAKIFAKAVNCESPVDGSPCGECAACRAIASGASVNVIEMDAASNRKIEDIRQVIEEVQYPPVAGKYKVYIVDEVHMLTDQASNALLKTLEEPPEYVIFILATTDPQKLLTTILSRCQRYDFRRISIEIIKDRLAEVLVQEGIEADEKALRYIAKCADGSMRDALSLLDQCVAFHFGKKLTYDMAIDVLGAIDTDVYKRLLDAVVEKNITAAVSLLEEVIILGRDLNFFVDDFTWYLRNLLLIKSGENMEDLIDVSSDNLKALREQAVSIPNDTLIRYIHIFCELSNRIRYEAQKRVLIEIELMRMCTPRMNVDTEALTQRMDEIENGIRNASYIVKDAGETSSSEQPKTGADSLLKFAEPARPAYEPAVLEDLMKITNDWNSIRKSFNSYVKTAMDNAIPKTVDGNTLTIVFDTLLGAAALRDEENRKQIKKVICDHVRKEVDIRFVTADEADSATTQAADLRNIDFSRFGMPVETEE